MYIYIYIYIYLSLLQPTFYTCIHTYKLIYFSFSLYFYCNLSRKSLQVLFFCVELKANVKSDMSRQQKLVAFFEKHYGSISFEPISSTHLDGTFKSENHILSIASRTNGMVGWMVRHSISKAPNVVLKIYKNLM